MDDARRAEVEPVRELPVKEITVHTDTRDILARGKKQIDRQRHEGYYIVDADAHHVEADFWTEVLEFIEDPVIRDQALTMQRDQGGLAYLYGGAVTQQTVGGRIPHQAARREKVAESGVHRDIVLTRRAIESIGSDKMVVFPTPLLGLAEHPQVEMQVLLGRAYTRWLTEVLMPQEPRIVTLILLPITDPKSALQVVKDFGDRKGVVGFMLTGFNHKPVHHNDLMPLWAEIEARGKPVAFHAGVSWNIDSMKIVNRFIGVHALSFVMCNMVHMTNWVLNGMPERFPKLKSIWIESGLAWIPFMMQRLDNEYMMRSSEAPLLKRLPSEYMTEMYYTSQPMEKRSPALLQATLAAIKAETQLMYASDWPHWDFDLPSTVLDLPYLSDTAKRNILGLTAARLFGLDVPPEKRGKPAA
jgi:predicted TIM-barrel fold metal-dependent hydrolase